jgi:hypothetical protein
MTTRIAESSYLVYARVAGFAFILYIVAGIASLALAGQEHVTDVLGLLTSLSALVLGVTLYMITREQGPALAMLALTCRVIEAVPGEAAFFFSVASTIFCWLLLSGRMIPVALAWLGIGASVLLVVILPLQTAGLLGGAMSWSASITWLVWMPMLVFELVLALWLIIKGVAMPQSQSSV